MKNRLFFMFMPSAVLFLMSCATPPANPTGATSVVSKHSDIIQPQPVGRRIVFAPQSTLPNPPPTTKTATHAVISSTPQAKHYPSFESWKQDFITKIQSRYGYVSTELVRARFNERAVILDGNQAEFDKMPWSYLDGVLGGSRVMQGQQKRRQMLSVLDRAEHRYGVPASIVTAIWGIESSYGANMGNFDLIDTLSSLAYDGRRREFAETQLMAMAELIDLGDVNPKLTGSWAGGMGHTQFIPKTWLDEGVDGDNDGKKSPFNPADALTSTASYLANAGWVKGLPAYIEVSLPTGFDYRHLGTSNSLDNWQRLGLSAKSGYLAGRDEAKLWLPAGINGPILLTTKNFEAIKVYNNSSNYALAVAALANKINGQTAFYATFPRHESPLSSSQVQRLQESLTRQGFDTQEVDGVVGTNTKAAFAKWQAVNGLIPDGFISQSSVKGLVY